MRASRACFVLAVLSAGCFQGVHPEISEIKCRTTENCPEHYNCQKDPATAEFGRCVSETFESADAGKDQGARDTSRMDGTVGEVALPSDGKRSDGQTPDVNAADANVGSDGSAEVDAPLLSDTPLIEVDAGAGGRDAAQDTPAQDGAAQDAPSRAGDTALSCDGCCRSNDECPLSAPVCNAANRCVGCGTDQDCKGRTLSACNSKSGACVQCTSNTQCASSNLTCDLDKNVCVGCTQRSDCKGACQTCSNGVCVAVKDADDPAQCTGTCDSAGECKAKKGQGCTSTSACIKGTQCSPDGVCCDRECKGSCEACNLPSSLGTCKVLAAGSKQATGHTSCGTGACTGTCQGASDGSCTFPSGSCGATSCTGTSYQAVGQCQQGTCSMPDPVSCKIGATCQEGACQCDGTFDCPSGCVNLDSDPKNCGSCGHDCLGGPCEGGFCKPYKLADVATGRPGSLAIDGSKVYAFTEQASMFDTTKVWQMSALTPGTAVKIPPDQEDYPYCVMDGTMVWPQNTSGGNVTFAYCSVSGCLTSTKTFSHTVSSTTSIEVYPVCDIASKEIVWIELEWLEGSDDKNYSVWRSSASGANLRQMAAFTLTIPGTSNTTGYFPSGRTDRFIYTLRDDTTSKTYSILTTTKGASPVLLASGAKDGPSDLLYAPTYGNDSMLVWSVGTSSYKMPWPAGIGTSAPAVFINNSITSGIMDNHHFYGFIQEGMGGLYWCSPSSCSPTILTTAMSDAKAYAQDAGAIYWAVLDPTDYDGFSIWKVAKQPY